ncbi:MAG TPA: hypothetical protein VNL35_01315 [Chloroflexota bacterium]|nr:hypothetical protein [Chloroflexota bacterium]
MNISHGGAPKRPSRLLDALRDRAHTGGSGRLGFGNHDTTQKRRLTVIASLAAADLAGSAALIQAGADGIEVRVSSVRELRAVRDAASGLSIPVGLVLGVEAAGDLDPAEIATGVDWVRLPLAAGAAVLTWEKPARFITIPPDLEIRRAPALNLLEIDAVVIEAQGRHQDGLSVEDLLPVAMLGEVIKRPLLLHGAIGIGLDLIGLAEQCGANGLLLPVEAATAAATIADYLRALERHAAKA